MSYNISQFWGSNIAIIVNSSVLIYLKVAGRAPGALTTKERQLGTGTGAFAEATVVTVPQCEAVSDQRFVYRELIERYVSILSQ